MRPTLGDLVAASCVAAFAGAAAFHVCMAVAVALVDGAANPEQAVTSFAGVLLISLFGLPFSIMSFLFVGSILGPLAYRLMARSGRTKPVHGVIAGGVVGAIVGLTLSGLLIPELWHWLAVLFAISTAFAGWTFERILRGMLSKPPPAPTSEAPTP